MLAQTIESLIFRRFEDLCIGPSLCAIDFYRRKGLAATGFFAKNSLSIPISKPYLTCARQNICTYRRSDYRNRICSDPDIERNLFFRRYDDKALRIGKTSFRSRRNPDKLLSHNLKSHKSGSILGRSRNLDCNSCLILYNMTIMAGCNKKSG